MPDEKRRFTRIHFNVNVELTVKDVLHRIHEISDLGIGGCLLTVSADYKPGTVCRIRILLSGSSSELSIQVDGEILRCTSETVAVKFIRIDPDSLFHLQNVVRYNALDPNHIDKEIQKHPGLI